MPLVTSDDTVALAGGANIERTRFHPHLQTRLVAAFPEGSLKVRNFGWEGDTVFEQWRDGGDVEALDKTRRETDPRSREQSDAASWRQQRDWNAQLSEVGATVVLAQFGQMESLAGPDGIPAFLTAYERLIEVFAGGGRRVILIEPVPFEKSDLPNGPDLPSHNTQLAAYTAAIRKLAEKRSLPFLVLTREGEDRPSLTSNGIHLSEDGHRFVALRIVEGLGLAPEADEALVAAYREMREFERLWFDFWRPMNWSFLKGDRTQVPYSRDWRDQQKRLFPEEMHEFLPLLEQAERNVRASLTKHPIVPIVASSAVPVVPPTAKPQSPEEELASFRILDGFAVNLFASESDGVIKPVQMRWDERGRLWVACALSYPQIKPGERANDYVLVCEDTDGDGKADRFHKFVEGLFMPAGIEFGDGGLYVAQGTELVHFADTDNDGKADERRLVLGGFGTADSHQMINCLNRGFGGELWFTQGHHIYSRVETPYGIETLNRAGVWRWRPRSGHLDPFFQWSSAGANCWGVVTTRYGQPFHKSGANIGAYYSTPGLVRSNLAVDSRAMNLCLAPIKQVGMEFLESSHFPEAMQGRILIGGYYGNTLEQHALRYEERSGLFSTELLPNLIETNNKVFRPIEVRTGPDGAIYVVDWYNPIIGHYQASYRHPDRDKEHGRIWRLTAKGRPLTKPSSLAEATLSDLLGKLDSKERWEREQVKRLLCERPGGEVVAALDAWVPSLNSGGETDEFRRLQALSIYEAHEAPRPELLKGLLGSADAKIRAYSTRALSTWARDGRLPGALALLEARIADEDPLVRLEAIVACSYLEEPRAAMIAARSLDADFNAYHRHALTKTLHATHRIWAPLLSRGEFSFEKDEHLLFALRNGWVENNPDDFSHLSGGAVDYHPQAASREVRTVILRQIEKASNDPARETIWLGALASSATPADLPMLLERGAKHPELLAAIRISPDSDPTALLAPLWAHVDPAVQKEVVRLSGLWKARSFTDRIRVLAFDEHSPLRDVAFESLLILDPDAAVARRLASLRQISDPAAAAPLLTSLLVRAEGRAALVRALEKPDGLPAAAAKTALESLHQIGRAEPDLTGPLMKLAGLNAALPVYTKEYVARLVKAARTSGDAAEGKRIYESAGCIACHIPGPNQSRIGPDLSAISRGLPPELLVTELVWPALNVKEGYEAATVTRKDGTVVTGFRQTETAEAIAIRDLATGEVKTIPRAEIGEVRTGGTVMPDGLTAGMEERQLAHLVRYLMSLGAE